MKILFVSRATLFSNPGGDTIQITQTAKCLNKLRVEVEIKLTNEEIQYSNYDLVHFFNIIRPADILKHSANLRKPYVVSTIFVDYSEFEMRNPGGIRRLMSRLVSADMMEYAKVAARAIRNYERIGSAYYIFRGHKNSIKKVISNAAMLLPNSESEYRRLKSRYEVEAAHVVVPNGIDASLFRIETPPRARNLQQVLCVARIEPLKNQLNLIKAIRNTNFRLLVIGNASANHQEYFEECKSAASENVVFIDYLPQNELLKYYNESQVHVLPSWFETTGLSSLEAAACGCNVVITAKGDTKEYFSEFAYYCDPASPESILNAVKLASAKAVDLAFSQYVIEHYTWDIAANKTLAAYNQVLLRTKA